MKPRADHDRLELAGLVREGRLAAFAERAARMPAVDLADVLLALSPPERQAVMHQLPRHVAAAALVELPGNAAPQQLLAMLDQHLASELLGTLQDHEATALVAGLDPARRGELLRLREDHAQLSGLLRHAEGTAGRTMTVRVVVVTDTDTAMLATESVRRQSARVPALTEIFVIDTHRRLVGVLPIATLLLAQSSAQVRDLMHDVAVQVGPDEPQRVVAQVVARYNLSAVPVVDTRGALLGRITADDVRHVAVDEAVGGLLRFGGVSTREQHDARWTAAVRSRLPSLYLNLLTAFGAAAVVYLFEGTLSRIIVLAVWMPVVAGVGGNAGTQALAASIRRLAGGDRTGPARDDVLREGVIGLVHGAAIGAVVGTLAVLLGESWKFGFVVLAALVANLASASVVGALLPVVLHRLGRDPSHASPVIVTAVTDAVAFALLLGLASLLLR